MKYTALYNLTNLCDGLYGYKKLYICRERALLHTIHPVELCTAKGKLPGAVFLLLHRRKAPG